MKIRENQKKNGYLDKKLKSNRNRSKERTSISNLSEARELSRKDQKARKKARKPKQDRKPLEEIKVEPDWKQDRYSVTKDSSTISGLVKKLDNLEKMADLDYNSGKNSQISGENFEENIPKHDSTLEDRRR